MLTVLQLDGTAVYGSTDDLTDLVSLFDLKIQGTDITGTVDALRANTRLGGKWMDFDPCPLDMTCSSASTSPWAVPEHRVSGRDVAANCCEVECATSDCSGHGKCRAGACSCNEDYSGLLCQSLPGQGQDIIPGTTGDADGTSGEPGTVTVALTVAAVLCSCLAALLVWDWLDHRKDKRRQNALEENEGQEPGGERLELEQLRQPTGAMRPGDETRDSGGGGELSFSTELMQPPPRDRPPGGRSLSSTEGKAQHARLGSPEVTGADMAEAGLAEHLLHANAMADDPVSTHPEPQPAQYFPSHIVQYLPAEHSSADSSGGDKSDSTSEEASPPADSLLANGADDIELEQQLVGAVAADVEQGSDAVAVASTALPSHIVLYDAAKPAPALELEAAAE